MSVWMNPRIKRLPEDFEASFLKAMPRATESADTIFREHEIQQFDTEGESGGKAWEKLKPNYAKIKAKKRPGRKILVWDGPLRNSLARRGPEHIAHWFRDQAAKFVISLGSKNRIGVYHEEGGTHLPRRSMLQMTTAQKSRLLGVIQKVLAPFAARAIRDAVVLESSRRAR